MIGDMLLILCFYGVLLFLIAQPIVWIYAFKKAKKEEKYDAAIRQCYLGLSYPENGSKYCE